MENIFITLVCITILLVGAVTIAMYSFNSIDMLAYAWKDCESRAGEMRCTSISSISSTTNSQGTQVEVMIKNAGQTDLAHFEKWDVIVKYQSGVVQRLPYTAATPGWTVSALYINGQPEVYEPNIFNPNETMKLVLKLSPPVASKTINLATISTHNGVGTEVTFGPP
jgi:archaellum component FlaF (FlaF/FlaG flagellin family)